MRITKIKLDHHRQGTITCDGNRCQLHAAPVRTPWFFKEPKIYIPTFSLICPHNKYPTAKYSKFLDAGFVIINFLFSARILRRQLQTTPSDVPFYQCSRAQCLEGLMTGTHSLRKNVCFTEWQHLANKDGKPWSEYMMERGAHNQQLPDVALAERRRHLFKETSGAEPRGSDADEL
jgi:hypothetical protein